MSLHQQLHPYQGNYKTTKTNTGKKEFDEYEVVALAKRLNITLDDMKEMSFVSLINILLSSVEEDETKEATQEDIDKFFGQEKNMETSTINIIIICGTFIVLSLIARKWDK